MTLACKKDGIMVLCSWKKKAGGPMPENKTQQDIADYLEKDTTTIWRNNKRLINEIKVYLFPNDVIKELNY